MDIQKNILIVALLITTVMGGNELRAEPDHYYYLPLRELDIDGSWPDKTVENTTFSRNWRNRSKLKYFMPYASADDEKEIYIDYGDAFIQNNSGRINVWQIQSLTQLLDNAHVAIRTEDDSLLKGTVYVPKPDFSGMTAVEFTGPKTTSMLKQESAREKFYKAMENHYNFLLENGFSGSAWFRYRSGLARQALEKGKQFDPNEVQPQQGRGGRDPFERTYSLFTGGRAVSENLQLDRSLQTIINQPRTIDIAGISGITTAQIDWKAEVEGLELKKDPLADYVPADQHAIFCPTFKEMMVLIDEMKANGSPIKHLIETEASDAQTTERYEQQMCLGFDAWSRFWGPKTIRSVVFTGSDPYLRVGSDTAVLFDASMTDFVYNDIADRQKKAIKTFKEVKSLAGKVKDVEYKAAVSPDRKICSYLAKINNVVVVTNSLVQLEKIVQTIKGKQESIAKLDEYTFFRSRYDTEDHEQTAFLILTDATIRRWCGLKWRIGAARRTVVAAILSQIQAEYLDNPKTFDLEKAQSFLKDWIPDAGTISMTEAGITSSTYGNLRYMTPIAELEIKEISEQENSQYTRFRQNYQRQWRNFFDPIAICFLLESTLFDVDMSIRPLIASSEYRQYIWIAGDHAVEPGDGDPHPESILQLILAIDADSEPIRQIGNFARQMTANQELNALGWVGNWITVYADESPFWKELSEKLSENMNSMSSKYMEENINRLPLAVALNIDSPAKLTMFLVSLRAFVQQTAPNMTTWETMTYKEKSYVRIEARFDAESENPPSLYYAVTPDQLILTFNEPLIHRALDRSLKPKDAKDFTKIESKYPWLGKNIAVRVDEKAWTVIEIMANSSYAESMKLKSWNNLPILRQWHTYKGEMSELDFHNRYWHTALICPGGGDYVWNKEYQTAESTVFGHPGQPKMPEKIQTPLSRAKDAQFGITFEEDGLRAKMKIERIKDSND